MTKADDPRRSTTDGKPPDPGFEDASAPKPIDPETGQHGAYWVLSDEELKKGFVRPVRRSYRHEKCGAVTKMGEKLSMTYAREPYFYSHTFCVECGTHFPVAEFKWVDDNQVVGS
jgi:hypothetical protein